MGLKFLCVKEFLKPPRLGPGVRTCRDQCGAECKHIRDPLSAHHLPGHRINKKRKASILCRSIESMLAAAISLEARAVVLYLSRNKNTLSREARPQVALLYSFFYYSYVR